MPSTCRSGLAEDHAERSSSRIIRPASRDRSEDARSGNIHQTVGQTKAKTLEQPTILERHQLFVRQTHPFRSRSKGCRTTGSDQSSLHNVCRTGAFPIWKAQTFFSSEDNLSFTRRRRSTRAPNDWRRALRLRKPQAFDARQHRDNSMVELSGIEPLTPCLQSRCSPS